MNKLTNSTAACNIKKFFCSLSKLQLKSDYNVKLSLYKDDKSEDPSCSHTMSGSCKFNVVRLAAILSASLLCVSALCSLLCWFNSDK